MSYEWQNTCHLEQIETEHSVECESFANMIQQPLELAQYEPLDEPYELPLLSIFIATWPYLLFANKAVFYPNQRGFWHPFESRHSNDVLFTIGSVQPTYTAILCMFTQK